MIVFTGNLLDAQTLALVREQLWDGAAMLGLADIGDARLEARLHAIGFSEVLTKPVARRGTRHAGEGAARPAAARATRRGCSARATRCAKCWCRSSRWRR